LLGFVVSPDVSELVVVAVEELELADVSVVTGGGWSLSGGRVAVVVVGGVRCCHCPSGGE
jgi:hypothetical protein